MPRYGMNNCLFIGNVTADAELKTIASGTSVCSFSLGVTEKGFGQNPEDKTVFIDVALFGKRAQALAQYIKKGDPIAVRGSLRITKRDREGGGQWTNVGVYADDIVLLGSRPQQQEVPPPDDSNDLPF